jgi:hypothetical protein
LSASGVSPTTPAAIFLERFGVLLAANSVAHQLWPALPQADAAQAADAAAMASQSNSRTKML